MKDRCHNIKFFCLGVIINKNLNRLKFVLSGNCQYILRDMTVLWSKPIICRVEGCYRYTFFDDLRENLENLKIHEMLAHPHPVQESIP